MHCLLDKSVHIGYGCFEVDFRSLRAVYRQRIYYCLVRFPCMLLFWLQRYHARSRTFWSYLVFIVKKITFVSECNYLLFQIFLYRRVTNIHHTHSF